MSMKIYLRHRSTQKYYSEKGEWINTLSGAIAFITVPAALKHVTRRRLSSAAVVLKGEGVDAQLEVTSERLGRSDFTPRKTREATGGTDLELLARVPYLD
jgi:hypothetical protein